MAPADHRGLFSLVSLLLLVFVMYKNHIWKGHHPHRLEVQKHISNLAQAPKCSEILRSCKMEEGIDLGAPALPGGAQSPTRASFVTPRPLDLRVLTLAMSEAGPRTVTTQFLSHRLSLSNSCSV